MLARLGECLPVGMMVILATYTLRDVDPLVWTSSGPVAAALAVTTGLHLWRHNATLSVFSGTAVSVLLQSAIAAAH
ncbi:AzlD domain-containing protein [Amycolatopsis panacis]|uniref:AzlD domain-containing protein n=1 Tax=Amycolatopsis panacis TaxID=2340917 RepID=UPI001F3E1E1B|nr:AzlD domain-containing protein [Amycolatopsis panacis]